MPVVLMIVPALRRSVPAVPLKPTGRLGAVSVPPRWSQVPPKISTLELTLPNCVKIPARSLMLAAGDMESVRLAGSVTGTKLAICENVPSLLNTIVPWLSTAKLNDPVLLHTSVPLLLKVDAPVVAPPAKLNVPLFTKLPPPGKPMLSVQEIIVKLLSLTKVPLERLTVPPLRVVAPTSPTPPDAWV